MPDAPDFLSTETPLPSERPAGPSRFLLAFVGLLVLATAFSFAFTPLRSSQDEWWHLKAGKWIVEHRGLPVNDIFTYAGADYRWYNHEWLSQVIFYLVYALGAGDEAGRLGEIGGVTALVAFKALVVTATFALVAWLARLRSGSWPVALLVAIIAADISRRTIYPRPPIFSYFLLAGFLGMLYSWKSGRLRGRWLWLLVPATVVWGNLHGMVLLAVVAVGAFAAGEAIERMLDRECRERQGVLRCLFAPPVLLLGALTGAVIVAAMAQPSGYHLFFLGKNFTADPILQRVIAEMLPPPALLTWSGWNPATLRLAPTWPLSLSFWLTLPVFFALLAANRFRLPYAADYLLTGFFAWQAVHHWRLLPLFAVAMAGPLAWLLAERIRRFRPAGRLAANYALLGVTALLAVVFVFRVREPVSFFKRNMALLRGDVMDLGSYPRPLMDFIVRARLPERMMSEINYCGYTIWRLSPEHHKLFTDNRFDLFGSRFYVPHAVVFEGAERGDRFFGKTLEEGWQDVLDRYGVNFIVTGRGNVLSEKLQASGRWKHVFYYLPPGSAPDGGYSVWLRGELRFAEAAERAASLFRQMNPGAPTPEQLDQFLREARTQEPSGRRREPGASGLVSTDPAASVIPTTAPLQETR